MEDKGEGKEGGKGEEQKTERGKGLNNKQNNTQNVQSWHKILKKFQA